MAIDAVSGATTPATDSATPASPLSSKTNTLGKEAFLNLLVTQLQHQNPLEPQADGEFLAQLAQFSSLESLQDIKADISAMRGIFESEATATNAVSQGGL